MGRRWVCGNGPTAFLPLRVPSGKMPEATDGPFSSYQDDEVIFLESLGMLGDSDERAMGDLDTNSWPPHVPKPSGSAQKEGQGLKVTRTFRGRDRTLCVYIIRLCCERGYYSHRGGRANFRATFPEITAESKTKPGICCFG